MAEEKEKTELHLKLIEAWENMPTGAKNLLYNNTDWVKQNVADILKNGRKDESTLEQLLEDIKKASDEIADDINKSNQIVQAL